MKNYVRRDFKCLTHEEKCDVIEVFKELYRNGEMDRLSRIHSQNWAAAHQTIEAVVWHRWFVNELEKQMRKIKLNIALPYWV